MARTRGQGNPRWTRDEVLLALDLYFKCDGEVLSRRDERVVELSGFLQRLPIYPVARRRATFRNPDGVAFKLQNLRNVAANEGLDHVSATDRAVWAEFGSRREAVARLAESIREAFNRGELEELAEPEAPEAEFFEGRLLTRAHKVRERKPQLRKRLLATRRKTGTLVCDLCDSKSPLSDAPYEDAFFEVHHLRPLAEIGDRKTSLSDLALLCACCHRILHRAIAVEGRWLLLAECRNVLGWPK